MTKIQIRALIPNKTIRPKYKLGQLLQGGQSMVEYLVLASLIAIALALGRPSILEQLISALQTAYQGFAMAMSMP